MLEKIKAFLYSDKVHKALAGLFVVSGFLVPSADQKYVLAFAVVCGTLGIALPSNVAKRVAVLEENVTIPTEVSK